jgi:hypothetical protein
VRIFITLRPDPYLQKLADDRLLRESTLNEAQQAEVKKMREETERSRKENAERSWVELRQ